MPVPTVLLPLILALCWLALGAIFVTSLGTGGVAHGATFTVTKTEDTSDAVCDADCSLREAIAVAGSGDTVSVPTGTYTLTLGLQLSINTDLLLVGAGGGGAKTP